MVTRRKLVFALGAGALAPLASFAQQQSAKVYRIGYHKTLIAIAAKNARIAWALLSKQQTLRAA